LSDDEIAEIDKIIGGAGTLEEVASCFRMPICELYEQLEDEGVAEYTPSPDAVSKLGARIARLVAASTPLRVSASVVGEYLCKRFASDSYVGHSTAFPSASSSSTRTTATTKGKLICCRYYA
jgi:hypothetical protein